MQEVLNEILERASACTGNGQVASYIPELAKAAQTDLGIAVSTHEGKIFQAGDAQKDFTIQSISKVLALAYIISIRGEEAVFSRVGKEPTGDPFNSIIRLETSASRKPFNPFINAGAIVVSSMMPGTSPIDRIERFRAFASVLTGRPDIVVNKAVYQSEKDTGARNHAIGWFLKELKLIDGEVENALDGYFMQCALMINAVDLSRIGLLLAMDGFDPIQKKQSLQPHAARIIKSLMVTCGMYDGSGEFALDVGIPAKSGVGGGITATVRDRMGIGIYGPSLDERGNSVAGIEAMKLLSSAFKLRVL